jgi:hypothetical protein
LNKIPIGFNGSLTYNVIFLKTSFRDNDENLCEISTGNRTDLSKCMTMQKTFQFFHCFSKEDLLLSKGVETDNFNTYM